MLLAMILLFMFLDRSLDRFAAILGGVGFGTFIDELGKFITSDNDYFFQPTIGLIYIIFIAIFLAIRSARRRRTIRPADALTNAMNQIRTSVGGPLGRGQRTQILALLDQSDPGHPLVPHLRAYVQSAEPGSNDGTHFYFRLRQRLVDFYERLIRKKRFAAIFPTLLLIWGVAQAAALVNLVYGIFGDAPSADLNWTHYAQALSVAVSVVCVSIGIRAWRSSRARAYRWYMRSSLVSIFITQVFVFFHSELAAIGGLTANLLTYATLSFVARLEEGTTEDYPGGE